MKLSVRAGSRFVKVYVASTNLLAYIIPNLWTLVSLIVRICFLGYSWWDSFWCEPIYSDSVWLFVKLLFMFNFAIHSVIYLYSILLFSLTTSIYHNDINPKIGKVLCFYSIKLITVLFSNPSITIMAGGGGLPMELSSCMPVKTTPFQWGLCDNRLSPHVPCCPYCTFLSLHMFPP